LRKLRIGIIDLVAKTPTKALYARVMNANLASIMPQVLGVWCEEEGHEVSLVCYTGFEDLTEELPDDIDLLIIGAFSQAAQLSYAISAMFRARGVVTCLGGPHARCYPQDAQKYFDYVLGFTDRDVLRDVLDNCTAHRPVGRHLSATQQPLSLPGVRARWKFIEPTLRKAPTIKIVPMLGSLGCPYSCSFCIDSEVKYQPLDFEEMKEDLRFLQTKMKRPRVGWHDPNFGVRFDDYMDAIEEAVPPGAIDFIAESSLSLLSEPHVERLARNGFKALLPGIESWYDLGNKSKTGKKQGIEKVEQVADHANMLLRHVPYLQTNFVLGLDGDEGPEPFELTKRFLDRSPGAFPGFSLLTAFGEAAPLNLEYQKDDRVLSFPFHFLNNHYAMNVRPRNYEWPEFYDHVIDLTRYSFSRKRVWRRLKANDGAIPSLMNVVRAISSEGRGRIEFYSTIRDKLATDIGFRGYFEGDTDELPDFYRDRVRADLGPFWDYLPDGAMHHDPHAFLNANRGARARTA
jgi:radical SAM superfamily enzyme YgiQ (UPF0313 family)